MKKIGLFYATKADKTTWVAEKIQKEFGKDRIEVVPIEQAWQNDFAAYDCFIVGASTWFDGELPTYWDELLPELHHCSNLLHNHARRPNVVFSQVLFYFF